MLLHAAVRVASGRTCVIHPVDGVRSDLCSFLSFEIFRLPHISSPTPRQYVASHADVATSCMSQVDPRVLLCRQTPIIACSSD